MALVIKYERLVREGTVRHRRNIAEASDQPGAHVAAYEAADSASIRGFDPLEFGTLRDFRLYYREPESDPQILPTGQLSLRNEL